MCLWVSEFIKTASEQVSEWVRPSVDVSKLVRLLKQRVSEKASVSVGEGVY